MSCVSTDVQRASPVVQVNKAASMITFIIATSRDLLLFTELNPLVNKRLGDVLSFPVQSRDALNNPRKPSPARSVHPTEVLLRQTRPLVFWHFPRHHRFLARLRAFSCKSVSCFLLPLKNELTRAIAQAAMLTPGLEPDCRKAPWPREYTFLKSPSVYIFDFFAFSRRLFSELLGIAIIITCKRATRRRVQPSRLATAAKQGCLLTS